MEQLTSFYQQRIDRFTRRLQQTNRLRNVVTTLKVVSFLLIFLFLYFFVARHMAMAIWISAGCAATFIALTVWDSRIVSRKKELELYIACNRTEIDYLSGHYSALDKGLEFLDASHAYAADLDIFGDDSLYRHLNRTVTPGGKQKLAGWLLNPERNASELESRQEAATELAARVEWCQAFRVTGSRYPTGTSEVGVIEKWLREPAFFTGKACKTLLTWATALALLSWVLAAFSVIPFFIPEIGFMLFLGVTAFYIKRVNRLHQLLGDFTRSISNSFHLIDLLAQNDFGSPRLSTNKFLLTEGGESALTAMQQLKQISAQFDQRNNLLVMIGLNGLFLRDLRLVQKLDRWKERYADHIERWMDTVADTDVLVSMGGFRFNHPDFTTPVIDPDTVLKAENLGHPLLTSGKKVYNDFDIDGMHRFFIVTGANMAGKSTFLRTVGVNLVLAASGNAVDARNFRFRPLPLFTSMRTTDNLAKGTSYFHAELLRLRQLVDTAEQEGQLFIILDEMLKGTNSLDKLSGSLRFLRKLLTYNISGLIATHDLELGQLAGEHPGSFENVCFEIQHAGNDIHYDYKIRPGVSQNMNASILLEQMELI